MTPKITQLPPLKLVGMRIQTSLANFGSPQLWQQFMPRRKQISNIASSENYSIQIYKKALSLKDFTPNTIFEYWAATPVTQFESIPDGMESLELDGGKYAVFIHKGTMAEFQNTLNFIYQEWLPTSGYSLNHLPHFEKLTEKYLGINNPDSEEEVWVPIK